jgi:hypothetical protein
MTALHISRKTFSGQGKPIVPRAREKNGQPQRLPKAISEERQHQAMRAVVLSQPHRAGDTSQHRIWPIGRMILDGRIADYADVGRNALLDAAERYSKAWGRVRWSMDSSRPYAVSTSGGRPSPTPQEKADIEREWGDIRRCLRDCKSGPRVQQAMNLAIIDAHPDFDERCFGLWIPNSCAEGLAALVAMWGVRA